MIREGVYGRVAVVHVWMAPGHTSGKGADPRLGGTPTPRSWVARMTKRLAPTGVGKSASHAEAWNLGVFHVRVCLGSFRHR
jgi:hypothetical protein